MGDCHDHDMYDFEPRDEAVYCRRCDSEEVYWDSTRGPNNKKAWVLKDTETLQRHVCGENEMGDIEPI
jgi:hypothetical protein